MGLFATDDGWWAACGRCPVALTCHTGWLRDVVLCPKCSIFQVRATLEKTCTDEHTGEEHITGLQAVFRVECPARQVDEDTYIDWLQHVEQETQGYIEDTLDEPDDGEDFMWTTRILIPDEGPPQKQYTNNAGSGLVVALCDQCYLKEVDDV